MENRDLNATPEAGEEVARLVGDIIKSLLPALKELDNSIKSGRRIKLKNIKRALQLMVDSISSGEKSSESFE